MLCCQDGTAALCGYPRGRTQDAVVDIGGDGDIGVTEPPGDFEQALALAEAEDRRDMPEVIRARAANVQRNAA